MKMGSFLILCILELYVQPLNYNPKSAQEDGMMCFMLVSVHLFRVELVEEVSCVLYMKESMVPCAKGNQRAQ